MSSVSSSIPRVRPWYALSIRGIMPVSLISSTIWRFCSEVGLTPV